MKLSLCTGAALLLCSTAVLAAPDSCERVKSDIQQKIINNGVPETAFSLAIVPNDQADQSQPYSPCRSTVTFWLNLRKIIFLLPPGNS